MYTHLFEILFWFGILLVIYTYIGYGILLYLLVRIKERFHPYRKPVWQEELPPVTLLIAAYNEEDIVDEKMENCRALHYPQEKLTIAWVTDGSTDQTNSRLSHYPDVRIFFQAPRKGKTAALNRAVPQITTPYIVFTDANAMLNSEALLEIVQCFADPRVGCVAGEKRIFVKEKDNASSGGEGFYWKYESRLKAWDARLYSAVGAAGELFAIRTSLFVPMPENTLLDDFILSMRIAEKGYKIDYCAQAYALENGSADIKNEEKRKIRIAAGGLQSIIRLRSLLIPDPFHLGTLRFQYISHRVLRWSLTPVFLFLLLPLNIGLLFSDQPKIYTVLLILQLFFYGTALLGAFLQKRHLKTKILFIPYYFLFMNLNVIKGFYYLRTHKGKGTWEKARRASTK